MARHQKQGVLHVPLIFDCSSTHGQRKQRTEYITRLAALAVELESAHFKPVFIVPMCYDDLAVLHLERDLFSENLGRRR